MNFYIQVNQDGYITDCIEQPHVNYIPVILNIPLPNMFISGAYKYLGGNDYELDEEKLPVTQIYNTEQLRADIDYIAIMSDIDLEV